MLGCRKARASTPHLPTQPPSSCHAAKPLPTPRSPPSQRRLSTTPTRIIIEPGQNNNNSHGYPQKTVSNSCRMPGPRYSKDHLALRAAVEHARRLPYDPSNGDWTIAAQDNLNGIITDSNGFIRASFTHPSRFTPEILLDLLLQACHTRVSTGKPPHLFPCRPRTVAFPSSVDVPAGSIETFAELLHDLHLGVKVAPVWEEDHRASRVEGRESEVMEKKRREERSFVQMLWTLIMLLPFVSFLVKRMKMLQVGNGQEVGGKNALKQS
ncbi:uncharacterized protein EV422DRAFT_287961 [Fimicolochytrium jonesii]|uniref:uncharacterized protein n=1 Tax=Fimicolochytrium jonesii TaxID=1396493 RepID=UPI0022FF286D|nr:uncharacterized protein EV422DRAFT_287961 [Fimicolochytrium jonesii]KAI8816532.1 hypothetical protein EV422DRAFT_287961 [Fimicolochytrium jonesii]